MALELLLNDQTYTLKIKGSQTAGGSTLIVQIDDKDYEVDYRQLDQFRYSLIISGRSYQVTVSQREGTYEVNLGGRPYQIQVLDEATKRLRISRRALASLGQQVISAPMPGKVIKLLVNVGDSVEAGQGIAVVEAMKMENELRASGPGVVKEIKVSEGTTVNPGEPLVILEAKS